MCECIKEINKKLEEAETNSALEIPMMLNMTENTVRADRTIIVTRKINTKKRGKAQRLLATFCPFCGEKY